MRALSGEEALSCLLKQSFALILLDVGMPGMDGFETARMIREHPRFERTPIIFVTGVHVTELDVSMQIKMRYACFTEPTINSSGGLFAHARAVGHGRHSGLGIGIGLASARRLAEMHGGTLEARSEGPGKGSEFVLRVPVADAVRTIERGAASADRSLEGVRVAVIDDNQDAADIVGLLIEERGALVRVAYDGASGVAAAQKFKPDVVILDIGLPDMDGYEACTRLRAMFGRDIRVIALTGWGQDRDKQLALDSGFDAHLTKPADPQQLCEIVRVLRRNMTAA